MLGVLALQRLVRDGQRGLSLRYVVWYAALSVLNVGLYVGAWLFQVAKGFPPILPANPAIPWNKLTSHQRSTALLTYQLEQLPYIALAIAVMSDSCATPKLRLHGIATLTRTSLRGSLRPSFHVCFRFRL